MAKTENVSIITQRTKYDQFGRRAGPLRKTLGKAAEFPFVGALVNTEPLEVWRRKMDQRNHTENLTDIPFGTDNRTLMLTTFLDSIMMLTDAGAWEPERRAMADGLRGGLFDSHGDFSYHTWLIARSSLGPKVLSNVVHGTLREGKPFPQFRDVLDLYERGENPHLRRKQYMADLAITLTSLVGPGAADYIMLNLLPSTTEMVQNPDVIATSIAGGAAGATGGVLAGLVIDALPGKDLGKVPKKLIPIVTGILGMLGANAFTQNVLVPGLEQTIQVTHIPLNQYGWTIPVVAAGGALVLGYPRFRRHKKAREAIAFQLDDLKGWRSMAAIMANSLDVMGKVNANIAQNPPQPDAVDQVANAIYTRHPALNDVVQRYHFREPNDVAEIQALAGRTLRDLADQVLFAEMISFFSPDAPTTPDGRPNPTIRGLIPTADWYFASLDNKGLATAATTCDLVKALGDKGEYVAALSVLSPSLAQIMITQDQMGKLGPNDDTQHFGEAYMNTGTMGVFVKLVEATYNRLLTVPDSKRAVITNRLKELGKQYTAAIPIGGLDRIYNTPAHMNLGALYGYAFLRARPHARPENGQPGALVEYGSKGLMSDVGKAVLEAMKINPLITYTFLADISVAVENADSLLVNVSQRTRKQVKDALISLQREVATVILKERLPHNKETAIKFFTDGDYAFEAYTAITMLTEVCGADVVEPILAQEGAALSPLFAEHDITTANRLVTDERRSPSFYKFNGIVGDTPNLYTSQLIDFYWNASRHPNPVHEKLVEFIHRDVMPLLVREYLERLKPGGRGELFDERQLANTREFAGYALESVHREDLGDLACQLADILDAVNRTTTSGVAPMGMMRAASHDIQVQAESAYRRILALIDITSRLVTSRGPELMAMGSGQTGNTGDMKARMEKAIEQMSSQIGAAMTTQVGINIP